MSDKAMLDEYRYAVCEVFNANIRAILADRKWSEQEKAGTLILAATAVSSGAAFQVAAVTPHLRNAPPDAQLKDFIELLREALTSKPIFGTELSLVPKGESA